MSEFKIKLELSTAEANHLLQGISSKKISSYGALYSKIQQQIQSQLTNIVANTNESNGSQRQT